MGNFSSGLAIAGTAVLIWSSAAAISYYSAKNHSIAKKEQVAEHSLSNETTELLDKVKNNSDDYLLHLELARSIQKDAFGNSDPNVLMQAVDEYKKVLQLKPDYPDALLGLAGLCMDAGINDQASKYYESYLKVRPDDLDTKTDYALSLVEGNKLDLAEKILLENISKEKSLKNILALSLVYKAKNNIPQALDLANQALALATTTEDKENVNEFIVSINKINKPDTTNLSPAKLIESYFREHQIIGPKVSQIVWKGLNQVNIVLNNFPIENMPSFAKDKLISNILEKFKILPNIITIKFISAESEKELLSIEVGSSNKKE